MPGIKTERLNTIQSMKQFHWHDYYELCKPKVVALIVFTAVVGMFMATGTPSYPERTVPWNALVF